VVIGLLLVVGYTYRYDLRDIGDRVLSELMRGARRRAMEARWRFRAERRRISGHRRNQWRTHRDRLRHGDSAVVLTQEAAKAAGCARLSQLFGCRRHRQRPCATAPVTLDRVVIGGIVERGVSGADRAAGAAQDQPAGMSFLNRLRSSEVRGDRLVLAELKRGHAMRLITKRIETSSRKMPNAISSCRLGKA